MRRAGILGVALAALVALAPGNARAQGCVVARPDAPVVDRSTGGTLATHQWQLSLGYRWYRSDRHYVGTEEQTQREREGSQDINDVSLLNFEVAYAITQRLSVAALLPFQIAQRSEPISDGTRVVARNRSQVRGIGDATLTARVWLRDPDTSLTQNVQLGFGIKLPTGTDNATDSFRSASGPITQRTVDTSIQPGDGGIGFPISLQAFYSLSFTSFYFSGAYLVNPREENGVNTYRPRPSETFASVADSYLVRTGAFFPVYRGLAVGIGGRLEGTPVKDALGGDGGFRRPGYVFSAEPAIAFASGGWAVSASVPIALLRARLRSVPERDDNVEGDAAFSDFAIGLGVSYRGGGVPPAREPSLAPAEPGARLGSLDARLRGMDGGPAHVDGVLGTKLTVVNVWASWCAPCREEIPLLDELSRSYAARGVSFVGISVDDQLDLAQAFVRDVPLAYPAFWGGEESGRALGVLTVPTTLFLDEQGNVVARVRGPLTRATLEAKIDALVPLAAGDAP